MYGLDKTAMGIVTFVIVAAIGLLIVSGFQDQMTADSAEYNATAEGITGISDLVGWLPVIVVIVIGAILLFLMRGFGGGAKF